MSTNERKVALGIRITPTTRARVEKIARAENRTFSNAVETLLREAVARRERKAA